MAENTPSGRKRNVSGEGSGVYKRGSGLGTGPVGNSSGYHGRRRSGSGSSSGGSSGGGYNGDDGERGILSSLGSKLGGKGIILIIIAVVVLLIGGGGLLGKVSNLFGGCSGGGSSLISSLLPSNSDTSFVQTLTNTNTSTGWKADENTGKLDQTVASGAREKRTQILGNGQDKVTVMVYLCGTDLESKNGMASSDLAEMAKATLSDKIEVIVLTGGCTGWKTKNISNSTNQIWRVTGGGIQCLESNFGNEAMTKPATLTKFIKWCVGKYPANRNMLIFWDHGGGSISGYGYDQRFTSAGGMTLAGINTALKDAGVTFDMIGFDTCLMATAENALMLSKYADYLVASEETEPGCGWYYTNFLTKLAANTSMPTAELGKTIIDDYTEFCASRYQNVKTTLSLVDLAELEATLPAALNAFANSTTAMIKSDDFSEVSQARGSTREYSSSKIDQVDLVNLADNIGTDEAKALSKVVKSAVKYNRTSSVMTNSYGLSIYFPYSKLSYVDSAVSTYKSIGMSDDYSRCIKQYASMGTAGQVASGGSSSPVSSLLGNLTGSIGGGSSDMISSLLGSFLGGGKSMTPDGKAITIDGLDSSNIDYMSDLDVNAASVFLAKNLLDATKLVWLQYKDTYALGLTDDQWKLVSELDLNVFIDDGEGYIDLGLDNVFEFTDEGYLRGEYDNCWLAINGQVVPYYRMRTDNGITTGRVPILLNGERAEFLLVFDKDGKGKVDGVRYIYTDSETGTVAKDVDMAGGDEDGNLIALKTGDRIDYVCDYYNYDLTYSDSYKFGDQLIYDGKLEVTDVTLPKGTKVLATYRFVDIYGQEYWSEPMK